MLRVVGDCVVTVVSEEARHVHEVRGVNNKGVCVRRSKPNDARKVNLHRL